MHETAACRPEQADQNSIAQRLQKNRPSGSHVQFKNEKGIIITVPVHPGRDVGRGLLRKIIRDIELTRKEFIELLEKV